MTDEQKTKCHAIIHTHAALCGGVNLIPIPGVGVAADIVTVTSMAMALAAVFGSSIPEQVAKGIAVAAIKRTVLNQPIKAITKELSKMTPVLGSLFGSAISIAMIESAGWVISYDLDAEADN